MVYNTDFLVAALIFLLIILYHFVKNRALDLENNRMFLWLVVTGIAAIVFDVICANLVSWRKPELVGLFWLCYTVQYTLQILVPHMLLCYVRSFLPPTAEHKRIRLGLNAFLAVLILMIFWNRWCGIFFGVEDTGDFYRGPVYGFAYVVTSGYMIAVAASSVIHVKELNRKRATAIWGLLLLAVVMYICQIYNPRVLLNGFGVALGITILFFTLNNPYYYTDSLTSAFDIRYFRERCRSSIERHRNFHILSVEMSQMKRINLVLGADIGSSLLTETAQILRSTSKQNLVFRISGKRFLVMAPSLSHYELLRKQVLKAFSEPIKIQNELVNTPVKICGIRNAQQMGSSNAILAYIDYLTAKLPGAAETCIIESDDETQKGFHYNQEVERYLDVALQNDLFEVVYQPVYSLSERKYVSIEVLSRLHHPGLGKIPPDVFITIAEKNDQIARIGLLQMRKVCAFVKKHPELMTVLNTVKVNLSPAELMKPGHAEELISIIREFALPTDFFQFEITETVATEYNETMGKVTDKFIQSGIGLCMDDFGSGYANLNTVLKLPFNVIKLDRSLLFDICKDHRTASLYESIVYSLRNMGFHIVSEGVETAQELSMVSGWGVDMIQGYYFARPMSGQEMLQEVMHGCPKQIECG